MNLLLVSRESVVIGSRTLSFWLRSEVEALFFLVQKPHYLPRLMNLL